MAIFDGYVTNYQRVAINNNKGKYVKHILGYNNHGYSTTTKVDFEASKLGI